MKTKFYPFTNNFVFPLVMQDEDICRGVLELILPDEEIGEIRVVDTLWNEEDDLQIESEKALKFDPYSHGVRFDVYVKTRECWVEIEMQIREEPCIGKRSRYYQANIDIDALNQGVNYKNLRRSYVIFICTYDTFKLDEPVYIFENYDVKNRLYFGDEAYKIVLNTACSPEKVSEKLRPLYKYIQDRSVVEGDLIKKIDDRVRQYNTGDWRRKLMTYEQELENRYHDGMEEGKVIGRKEGELVALHKLVTDGLLSAETAAERSGMTVDEFEEQAKSSQNSDSQKSD